MRKDILFRKRKFFNHPNLILTQQQIHSYCLVEIEKILNRLGKSIEDFEGIPQPDFEDIKHLDNRIIREELNYNAETLKTEFELSNSLLNFEQRQVLDSILHAVYNDIAGVFFIYGHGGTGKTFLYRTIAAKLRSERKIVLTVASSGQPNLFHYLFLITKGGKQF